MRAKPDGFELTFTEAVDPKSIKPESFSMAAWTYIYQSKYGSPEVDQATPGDQVSHSQPRRKIGAPDC